MFTLFIKFYKIGLILINRLGWYWAVEAGEILEGRRVDRASCCERNVGVFHPLTHRSRFSVVFFQSPFLSFCLPFHHKRISSLNCWSSHFTLPHLSTHTHTHARAHAHTRARTHTHSSQGCSDVSWNCTPVSNQRIYELSSCCGRWRIEGRGLPGRLRSMWWYYWTGSYQHDMMWAGFNWLRVKVTTLNCFITTMNFRFQFTVLMLGPPLY